MDKGLGIVLIAGLGLFLWSRSKATAAVFPTESKTLAKIAANDVIAVALVSTNDEKAREVLLQLYSDVGGGLPGYGTPVGTVGDKVVMSNTYAAPSEMSAANAKSYGEAIMAGTQLSTPGAYEAYKDAFEAKYGAGSYSLTVSSGAFGAPAVGAIVPGYTPSGELDIQQAVAAGYISHLDSTHQPLDALEWMIAKGRGWLHKDPATGQVFCLEQPTGFYGDV